VPVLGGANLAPGAFQDAGDRHGFQDVEIGFQGFCSPPFAEVILQPQFLAVPLSRLAVAGLPLPLDGVSRAAALDASAVPPGRRAVEAPKNATLPADARKAEAGGDYGDAALLILQTLIPLKNYALMEKIKKEKALSPEDLYYVGFHFSEKLFDQKDFGVQVMRLLAMKFKSSPYAKKAKKKLETFGIPLKAASRKKN
jgi:hypothetical protein